MEQTKYKVLSTKLSAESYKLLVELCARNNITMYEMLQMVCDTLIRYMDDRHNLSPEMESAMAIFDHMIRWKDAVNLANPECKPQLHEATYFYSDHSLEDGKEVTRRQGCRAVHVELPMLPGQPNIATYNIQEIVEKTLCLITPDRYARLRKIAVEMGTTSILHCIDRMINKEEKEEDLRELRRPFEDTRRLRYGKEDLTQYVKRKARGADNMADRRDILGEGEDLWAQIESGADISDEEEDEGDAQ